MPLLIRISGTTVQAAPLDDAQKLARAVNLYCESRLGVEAAAALTDTERMQYVADALATDLRKEARRYKMARAERAARDAAQAEDDV